MTDDEKNKAWRAEQRKIGKQQNKLQTTTLAEIARIMTVARRRIREILLAAPTDYQTWLLPQLEAQMAQALNAMSVQTTEAAKVALLESWSLGVTLLDAPLLAAGVSISASLPVLDTRQLLAIQHFTTSKIGGITAELLSKVNTQLGLVVMGAQAPSDAVTSITSLLQGEDRSRAITIVRHELGQVSSIATYERMLQSTKLLPGLRGQWRKSRRLHPRASHVAADGQIQEVGKPFWIGGYKLRFPRDPKGPLKEVINCGCTLLPYMESWNVQFPRQAPR